MSRWLGGDFISVLWAASLVLGVAPALAQGSVFDDAVAVWHMSDADATAAGNARLLTRGAVQLGDELSGDLRRQSLRRGGDGMVARFRGGFLRTLDDRVHLDGKEMTICMRVQDPNGSWSFPLFGKDDPRDPYGRVLYGKNDRLQYVWRTTPLEERVIPGWMKHEKPPQQRWQKDRADGVLRIGIPVKMINPTAWHDVVVRFRGPNLELFVDGVLVDEEWPHGGLYRFSAPFLIGAGYDHGKLVSGFQGRIDHVALWDRALRDEEIAAISGGKEEVARREIEILGPPHSSMQYWRPRGYNTFAGDCMPFYHDGVFHLFYLFDRRHQGSKWRIGGLQYGHASSRDLVHWQHHPLAVPITQQWECATGTGGIGYHDGKFYVYYCDCGFRCEFLDKPQRGSWIFAATSTDGIHFEKNLKPVCPGTDSEIFRDPSTGLFYFVRGGNRLLVSEDLVHWRAAPGPFVPRQRSMSCPDLFQWNGRYYFTMGIDRGTLWMARNMRGPWTEIKPNLYDGLLVPKAGPFTGNRRLVAGFLEYPGRANTKEYAYAGNIVFRELIQYGDGSLGMKFAAEMVPPSGDPVDLGFEPVTPGASGDGKAVRLRASSGFAVAMLTGVPTNARVSLQVTAEKECPAFGLCFRGMCQLQFEPSLRRVQYRTPDLAAMVPEWRARELRACDRPLRDVDYRVYPGAVGYDFAVQDVDGLDRPFALDIILKDRIIDCCIDQRRTIITRRRAEPEGDRLLLFAYRGGVRFRNIAVRRLRP